jgi:hypothetical protein
LIRPLAFLSGIAILSGCVVTRRFDGATQAALARSDMRVMETNNLRLYYPAERKAEALRFAGHVEGCVDRLRRAAFVHNSHADRLVTLVYPEVPLNNAYVIPPAAGEPVAVVPTFATTDAFALFGIPPDSGFIGCHEVVHYIHATQVAGFPGFLTSVFGDAYTPQIGLDAWFWEGLAVFHETKLQSGGRLGSRYWNGVFNAGVASKGINGGDLSELHRQTPYGSHYLIGSHFVDYLAKHYGEDKLWQVVRNQAGAFFFPFGVNTRFKGVYGKTLASLINEFDDALMAMPVPAKPADQVSILKLGTDARYERGEDGSEAIIDASQDQATTLRVFGPDGKLRVRRLLTDILPPRRLIVASPLTTSGISFTRDGKKLYFVALDQGQVQPTNRLMVLDVENDSLKEVWSDMVGAGGAIDPAGKKYVFSRALGDRWAIGEYDIGNHAMRTIVDLPRTYLVDPRVSPDGTKIVATIFEGAESRVAVFDRATGKRLSMVPSPEGAATEARWVNDQRVTFVAPHEGKLQAFLADIGLQAYRRITDAPFLAYRPRPFNNRLRFLDREGWRWTLNEVAMPADPPAPTNNTPMPAYDYPDAPAPLASPTDTYAHSSAKPFVDQPPKVNEDGKYSHFDGLFLPQVRGPAFGAGNRSIAIGLGAIGGDKLGFHRWGLQGTVDYIHKLYSGSVAYLNSQLAPWYWALTGSHVAGYTADLDNTEAKNEINRVISRETVASLEILREFYGNAIALRGQYLGLHRRKLDEDRLDQMRFVGGTLEMRWAAVEATPYAGARRAIVLLLDGSHYPARANIADWPLTDLRAALTTVVPLPVSKRHTFRLAGRVRRLIGPPTPLLQIGGTGEMIGRSAKLEMPETDPIDILPPSMQLGEPLRGFEDLGIFSNGIVIGDATYRYPIIVDWGSASSLYLLPSFFLRQIDIELFGMAASLIDRRQLLSSVGSALTLRFAWYRLPLAIRGQIARRLSYDIANSAFVTVGLEL